MRFVFIVKANKNSEAGNPRRQRNVGRRPDREKGRRDHLCC